MEMEMIVGRTPLKARNQTFTPALGLLNITITLCNNQQFCFLLNVALFCLQTSKVS